MRRARCCRSRGRSSASSIRSARRTRRRAIATMCRSSKAGSAEITGFAGVSLEPNAGSQGEYAGLLVIRKYHAVARRRASQRLPHSDQRARHEPRERGDGRLARWCRWPASTDGDIDVADLRAKAEQHAANLAALMVTYPSTHGVFEESDPRDLRGRPRAWRAGLHGWREHERAGRALPSRPTSARTCAI